MPLENEAYIDRETGEMHLTSLVIGVEQHLPDDIHDGEKYIAVPHKNELELGKRLTLRFADDFLGEDTGRVADYFLGRSAYGKFKDLLERLGLLQLWYEYESEATGKALRERASEAGLQFND